MGDSTSSSGFGGGGSSGGGSGGLAGGLSGGMKLAAAALLVHQLWKHAHAGQPADDTQAQPSGGMASGGMASGGLGSILGGLLGGAGGGLFSGGQASPAPANAGAGGGILSGSVLGGLGGLLNALRGHGLGQQVDSWVAPGPNQQVPPDQLAHAFPPEDVAEAARQGGTDSGSLLREVSRLLPEWVDKLTPNGQLPQAGAASGGGGQDGLQALLNSVRGGGGPAQR